MSQASDNKYMAYALQLAQQGLYTTMPNPRVGCVLVKAGSVVGEGWHVRAGEGHAEINALAAAGAEASGSTAYVTLEPCSHTGKTGPCSLALIEAGVKRVVFGMEDPNPEVAGAGINMLREAGVLVDGPVLEEQCLALNPGFIKRMLTGQPKLISKSAISLDGRTAMASGQSKWITGPQARSDVQRLRARSCAIITSAETVMMDTAQYTVRPEDLGLAQEQAALAAQKQPLRVIVDSQLRLHENSLCLSLGGPILLVHCQQASTAETKQADLPERVELLALPSKVDDKQVDLRGLVVELGRRQCNEVLVEAGAGLTGAFLRKGLLDELVVYQAPCLMGSLARPLFDLPINTMAGKLNLKMIDVRQVGSDIRITAVPEREE